MSCRRLHSSSKRTCHFWISKEAEPAPRIMAARSTVTASRESKGQKNFGIVTWHTEAVNQSGERVVDFHRTNLVRRQKQAE